MSNPFASSADVEKHFNKSRSSQEQQYTSSSFQEPYINDVSRDYKLGGTSNINVDAIDASEKKVKRELKPRVVSMMALGGTIGTGLFLNIATPLSEAGPVNALISYIFVGTIVYGVTQSLGEMATYIPESASFTVYGRRMLSRSYGFASGYMYWFNWVITLAVELSVVGQVIQYWTYDVPLWAWILIFWVVLTIANLSPVKYYGEIEFWIACIKVIAIIGFLIYALCMVCGAGKTGPVGFRYWRNPGPWGPGKTSTKRFLGWVDSLINAIFTYQGTELVGVTAGEAKNPKKSVPKAINTVFYRIIIFYIGSLFFLGLLVPYNDPKLSSTESYIAASPFVIAMNNAGTKILPDIFNAVVLTTVLSAANSNIYTSSRVLYALSELNIAPKIFGRCNKVGVPVYSVLFSSLFGALGFMSCTADGNNAFNWLIQISAVAGLFAWLGISFCHIRFMQAIKYRGMSRDDLPFKAKLMPFFAYYSAFFVFILIFVQGYAVFMDFNAKDFFINYISVIIFFVVYIGHQVITRHKPLLSIEEVDVTTGVRTVEEEEEDLLEEEKEREEGSKISRIFNNFF